MVFGPDNQYEASFLEDNIIELRSYDIKRKNSYYSWKLGKNEIKDVCAWWLQSGLNINRHTSRTVSIRLKNVTIQMITEYVIYVKSMNECGHVKTIGANLPVDLIENLSEIHHRIENNGKDRSLV